MPVTRRYKIIGFSVPPAIADQIEDIARRENRTKSELFREMFRVWEERKQTEREREFEYRLTKALVEAEAEKTRSPRPEDPLLVESLELAGYGQQQAEKLGLTEHKIDRIVYEERQQARQPQGGS